MKVLNYFLLLCAALLVLFLISNIGDMRWYGYIQALFGGFVFYVAVRAGYNLISQDKWNKDLFKF